MLAKFMTVPFRHSRIVVPLVIALLCTFLAAAGAGTAAAATAPGPAVEVQTAPANSVGFVTSWPVMTPDGRYVAYTGDISSAQSGGFTRGFYLLDREQGTISLLAPLTGGSPRVWGISADGGSVAVSQAPTAGLALPYLVTRTGDVTAIPVPDQALNLSSVVSMAVSADGQTVAFAVGVTPVNLGGTQNPPQVYVWDRTTGTELELGQYAVGDQLAVALSGDGATLAVNDQTAGATTAGITLYRLPGGVKLASVPVQQDVVVKGAPSLDADGKLMAYSQVSSDGIEGVAIYDVAAGTTSDLPAPPINAPPKSTLQARGYPQLSADGSAVVYTAIFANQVYEASPLTATPVLVSQDGTGRQLKPPTSGYSVTVSGTGTQVAFLAPDQSQNAQLWIAGAGSDSPPSWSAGAALRTSSVSATEIDLAWPAASDDVGVSGYDLTENGTPLASVPGNAGSYQVTELTPATAYTFTVTARDAAGHAVALSPLSATTTSGTATGQARLTATAAADGSVALSWDAAPGASSYTVLRQGHGPGSLQPVATAVQGTTYKDTGLPADTSFDYEVEANLADGTSEPWTVTAGASTPDLTLADASVAPAYVPGSVQAALGSALVVRAHGQPGRTVTAQVTTTDTIGHPTQSPVTLNEVTPGAYAGSLQLGEGTTSVTAATVTEADGAGHTATLDAPALPVSVSGALSIDVEPAAGQTIDFTGARLTVLNSDGTALAQLTVGSPGKQRLAVVPGTDYSARITLSGGTVAGTVSGLDVIAGTTSAATLTVTNPASLQVKVDNKDGDAEVTVTGPDGALLGSGTGSASTAASFTGLKEGQTVTIGGLLETPVGLEQAELPAQTMTLAGGENDITLAVATLPTGNISGTVTSGADGSAVTDATVHGSVTAGGRSFTQTAQADSSGHYQLTLPAGDSTVWVTTGPAASSSQSVTIPANGTVTQDLSVVARQAYNMALRLYTAEPGAAEVAQPIDWRVATHYQMTVTGPDGGLAAGDQVAVNAVPGSVVTWCVNGNQAGLPSKCVSLTLSTATDPELDIHLDAAGTVSGTLVTDSGAAFSGSWSATLTPTSTSASATQADSFTGSGSSFSLPAPVAGSYQLVVRDVSAADSSSPVAVTVASGATVNAGQITLGRVGPYSGPGNTVTSPVSDVEPGGTIDVTARWAARPATSGAAALLVNLPHGTTLDASGVIVNGRQVTSSRAGDEYNVPLTAAQAAAGTATFAIDVPSPMPAQTLTTTAAIQVDGATPYVLGSAPVTVNGVVLTAPARSTTDAVTVAGSAPANDTVTIDADGEQIAQATATTGGLWQADVTLPDRGADYEHSVSASVGTGTSALFSPVRYVFMDPEYVTPTSMSMRQPDGRLVTVDPRGGVASFPYVYVPGEPLEFSVTLPGVASQITGATFTVGASAPVEATCSGDTCTATDQVGEGNVGPVFFNYDPVDAPWNPAADVGTPPTEDQLRQELPPALSTFTDPVVSAGSDGSSGSLAVQLPGITGTPTMTTTVKITHHVSYTPTADDTALAAEDGGVPIYGRQITQTEDGDSLTVDLTTYVPESALQAATPSPAAGTRAAADEPGDMAEVNQEVLIKDTLERQELKDLLWSALNDGDEYDKLSAIMGSVTGCDPELVDAVNSQANTLADYQLGSNILDWAFYAFGALGGPETLGLSEVAATMVSKAYTKSTEAYIEHETEALAEFADSLDCSPLPKHVKLPDLDPEWIFDPSGYTYEGLPSDRLAGVTATLLTAPSASGPFTPWDATAYGQQNPLVTDQQGDYGWDVPKDWWRVAFSKPGYATAYSQVFQVLPEHLDVNVSLSPLTPPDIQNERAVPGDASAVTVTFDRPMQVASVTAPNVVTVAGPGRGQLPVTVHADDPQTAPDGQVLADAFTLTPSAPFTTGEALSVSVAAIAQDYAGNTLAGDATQALTAGPPVPPATPAIGAAWAGNGTATVTWAAPVDDGGSPITGYSVTAGGTTVTAAATATQATITGLPNGQAVTVSVAAVNAAGTSDPATSDPVTPFAPITQGSIPPPTSPPAFTAQAPPLTAGIGTPYRYQFTATGDPAPTFRLGGGAPSWLKVDSNGLVSGTPPARTKSFTYTITATSSAGQQTEGPYSVTVSSEADVTATLHCPPTLAKGATATCTLLVANAGPALAANVTVLGSVLPPLQLTGCSNGCRRLGGVLGWSLGSLEADQADTLTLTVKGQSAGKAAVAFAVGGTSPDPDLGNNAATATVVVTR